MLTKGTNRIAVESFIIDMKNKGDDKKNFWLGILFSLGVAHLLNDTVQSTLSACYPLIKEEMSLSFGQIGLIILAYQMSASIFQPIVGVFFDKRPNAYALPVSMLFSIVGIFVLASTESFILTIVAVCMMGIGSSILHPEAARITHFASGGRKGLAQSVFQVGGNLGTAFGPLAAAFFISPYGLKNISYFSILSFCVIAVSMPACRWYARKLRDTSRNQIKSIKSTLSKRTIIFTLGVLLLLVFSKNAYTSSFSSYYTFYLISKFGVSIETSQIFLFVFMFFSAIGIVIGGPLGDKLGRKLIIWCSILGAAPFALMMPYANLFWTCILSIIIGTVISSAFSAILVYAQELLPMKVGLVSGLFFGLAFGVAGISSAILGEVADVYGIEYVYKICSFLPLTGAIAYFLPRVRTLQEEAKEGKIC